MALETRLRYEQDIQRAIMELQNQRFIIAAGGAAGADIAVPGIKTNDTVAAVLNLTDLTSVDTAAVKAMLAGSTDFDSVLEAHASGIGGNALRFTLVGDAPLPVKASFGGAEWAGGYNSVLEAHQAGVDGNDWKIIMIGDSAPGAGVTVNVVAGTKTATIHYESGVSTVANVDAAITALADANDVIDVKTAGTAATILTAPADNIGVTNLENGFTGGVTVTVTAPLVTVHYQTGVSTVAQVEAAIDALSGDENLIDVKTTGTGATVLTAPAANITAGQLAGGLDAVSAEIPVIQSAGNIRFSRCDTSNKKLLVVYYTKPA